MTIILAPNQANSQWNLSNGTISLISNPALCMTGPSNPTAEPYAVTVELCTPGNTAQQFTYQGDSQYPFMSVFQGFLQTSAVALLPTLVSATALSSMFGLYQSVQSLSSQIGPAIGGIAAAHIGFTAVFPLAAIALLVLGLPMFWNFKRVARKAALVEREPDLVGLTE